MKPKNPIPLPAADTIPDISFELLSQAADGVVIIDELLEVSDTHGAASHIINPASLIGIPIHDVEIITVRRIQRSLGLGLAQALHILHVLFL